MTTRSARKKAAAWETPSLLGRRVTVANGSHWEETEQFRVLDHLTRGDIFWLVLGHLLLLPLVMVVLLITAAALPLYKLWQKRRWRSAPAPETHGEVVRLMNDPYVHPAFERGLREDVHPTVSVVMPLYNAAATIEWATTSVLRQVIPDGWAVEFIVVDNGCTDDSVRRIERLPLKIIKCDERGPGAARNAGIAAARAPIVAFTDSDCVVDTLWLQRLIYPLQTDKAVLLTGGEILAAQVDGFVASFANEAMILSNRRFFEPGPYFPRFFATANLACQRDAALAIGGFDNSLSISEDADFCWRLMELGGKMEFRPTAVIYHQHRLLLGQLWRQAVSYGGGSVSIFVKHRHNLGVRGAIAWKNLRDIAWSPAQIAWDQFTADTPYGKVHEILYCFWRLGFSVGSLRECIRRRIWFF